MVATVSNSFLDNSTLPSKMQVFLCFSAPVKGFTLNITLKRAKPVRVNEEAMKYGISRHRAVT